MQRDANSRTPTPRRKSIKGTPLPTLVARPRISVLPFLFSGSLILLAYPPIGLWPVSWFSFVPLLRKTRSLPFALAFLLGLLSGLIFNAGLLYWIALNSGAGGLLAPLSLMGILLVMPLYWGVFAALWSLLWRRWGDVAALLLPAVWVGLEVLKNIPEIGFPWQELGLTQINFLPAAQLAELGGIRLVSAWVMGMNVAIFLALEKRRGVTICAAAILAAGLLWGTWRMYHLPPAGPRLTVTLAQGNVDPEAKWQEDPDSSFAIYERLTRAALAKGKSDLVLWPETAIPVYLGHQREPQLRLRHLARELGVAIMTGAPHYEFKPAGGYDRLNSAFLFPKTGAPPLRYDKKRLVPFGERVPLQRWFPRLGELNFGQAEFTPGKAYTVFTLEGGIKISAQICFESVFGEETRRYVLNGARVLGNLTNDAWYGNSSGPYQHAALVRFRSIETRCPLVRAANTGISLAVNRRGEVIGHMPWGERNTRTFTVESGGNYLTFYVRFGELIPYILALAGLLGVLATVARGFLLIKKSPA